MAETRTFSTPIEDTAVSWNPPHALDQLRLTLQCTSLFSHNTLWTVFATDKNFGLVERKIIRRIYGPVRQEMEWRTRNNEQIGNILRKEVRFLKTRRINRIGQVEGMEDSRMSKRVMREKIYAKRRRGRPKVRWLDDVQEDLRAMGIEGWRRQIDRDLWRRIAKETKAHVGL